MGIGLKWSGDEGVLTTRLSGLGEVLRWLAATGHLVLSSPLSGGFFGSRIASGSDKMTSSGSRL
jgi:hypothetical protein